MLLVTESTNRTSIIRSSQARLAATYHRRALSRSKEGYLRAALRCVIRLLNGPYRSMF